MYESGTEARSVVLASLKERYRLNHPSSHKETYHVVLDLRGHSLRYAVGDCIGVYPSNAPPLISRFLRALGADGSEIIQDKSGVSYTLQEFLTSRANLVKVSKRLSLSILQQSSVEHDLIDLVEMSKGITPQELISHLFPLLPRLYSISSSMSEVGEEAHLTVAVTEYERQGERRYGACSSFLCHSTPVGSPIPIYLDTMRDFTLPPGSEQRPIIMVGPGTGVAPFRGFMQERARLPETKNWLFFGERHRAHDFYYENFWHELMLQGKLRLELAFSRDQGEKIYVQHKMMEQGHELWQWLQEGAYLYVCGDATRMAKDVEATFQKIIQQYGNMTTENARAYLRTLRKEKRYLRDIY